MFFSKSVPKQSVECGYPHCGYPLNSLCRFFIVNKYSGLSDFVRFCPFIQFYKLYLMKTVVIYALFKKKVVKNKLP